MGLRAGTIALRRAARPIRLETRLRHRDHSLVHLRISHRLRRIRVSEPGVHNNFYFANSAQGLAQSPVFPGNGRIVAAWFPTAERGRASAIFNSSQYFALPIFAPIFGGLLHHYGWQSCFWFMGAIGALFTVLWFTNIYGVKDHPRISQAEVETIERGGGLVNTDANASAKKNTLTWATVKMLLSYRMLVGVYIGQYCITTLTWFFLTWFPLYLAQERHMSVLKVGFAAAVPGLCGGFGGILGGFISDGLLRRGCSLSFSRKLPIMAGMALSMTIIACNYASSQSIMLLFMSISFFGKGIGALGWTVISDTSPRGHGRHERRAL